MTDGEQKNEVSESFFCPIGTELTLRFEQSESQARSTLVGMDRGKYLIIRTPAAPELDQFLVAGKSIKAIFLHGGTIYGFVSKILKPISTPAPLCFISYPEIMQRNELRKDLRIDCSIPAVIREKEHGEFAGVITDLSSGGCRVTIPDNPRIPAAVQIDKELELSCEMLGIGQESSIRSIVRNINQDKKRIHIGLQFETSDAHVLERIQMYVNHVLGVIY